MEGMAVQLRVRLSAADAHYGGNLVDGAHGLELFGDVVTELAIRTDGDEGLFAGYSTVEFLASIQAGDVLEATATVTRIGSRSRELRFEARVVCRASPDRGPSAARVLDPPVVVTRATGTVVVPGASRQA